MNNGQLKSWMARHRLSVEELSRITDIDEATLESYLNGSLPVPKVLHLACIAFENGLCPWGW